MSNLIEILPKYLFKYFQSFSREQINEIEEVRFYADGDIVAYIGKKSFVIHGMCSYQTLQDYFNSLMKYSYHTYEEDVAQGFITIEGGFRVGICGKVVLDKGTVKLISEISSINIRAAKAVIGCSDKVMAEIMGEDNKPKNTLIISPPGCGKTTLIRDICRNMSLKNIKVGICDERSEIAAVFRGKSSFDMGSTVDVLDRCPKSIGMKMLLRSMSPDIIVTDEIGRIEDFKAIEDCITSGTSVLTSVHGSNLEDVMQKPLLKNAIENKYFKVAITLTSVPMVGTVKEKYVF